ncbi:hypothetical protein BS17DRAFT_134875 [Gyrodon lividus]|nr:hypothetical protein BS17DRAFT_134875 [Gyrodon lividus]
MGDASFIPLPTTTGTLDIDPPILRVASPVFAHDLLASAGHPYSQPKTLCGWSRSFEETPVASSQSIPQFPSMADADFSSCQGYDAWERHMLDGVAEYQTPSDRHSTLPIYSTLPGFKDATQNNSNQTLPTAQAERMRTHALVPSTRHQQEISSSDRSQGGGATGGPQMYKCQWSIDGDRCLNLVHGDRRSIIGHLHEVHGMKPGDEKVPQRCSWYSCTKTINKESIPRHILTVHLKEKAYCTWCGLSFAREDSLKRHLKGVQHKTLGGKERPHRCYPGPEV